MGNKQRIPWESIHEFLIECGQIHDPHKFCVMVLEKLSMLVKFDEGLFFMLDGNRRIVRKYFKNIPRKWSSLYMEYYARVTNHDFALDADISETNSEPYVEVIDWANAESLDPDFRDHYIRPRGLCYSLAFVLFDLNGAPATAFSLDRRSNTPFSNLDLEVMGIVTVHLNNLYKNMFIRPSDQVNMWDKESMTKLTPREAEVAELLCQGVSPANIARELHVSIGTTNKHVSHIYKKVGVGSRQELLVRLLGK